MNHHSIKAIHIKLHLYNEMTVFSNFNAFFFLEIRTTMNFVKSVSS